jgi:peptidoglycan/LPS O-acetylase OafA/YrhL
MPHRPAGRRPELDVVRALVVAGLVVFHSAMVFAVGTSWFVKDPRPSIGFSVFLLWGSLWGMPLPVIVTEAVFGPHGNTGGWERLAYVFPFLYGFLIASDARFEFALSRVRWPALTAAAAATVGLLGWAVAAGPSAVSGAEPGWSALQCLAGWAWLAAIAGFAAAFTARRRQTGTATPPPAPGREPRWQRASGYANQAVLPFYLLHEPVIVAFAWIIVRWHAPILIKYPVLVAASFAATLVIYEFAIRRCRITRLLFGMKTRPWVTTECSGSCPTTRSRPSSMLPDRSRGHRFCWPSFATSGELSPVRPRTAARSTSWMASSWRWGPAC